MLNKASNNPQFGDGLWETLTFITDCLANEHIPVRTMGNEIIHFMQKTQNEEELHELILLMGEKLPKDEFGFPRYLDSEAADHWLKKYQKSGPKELSG